MISAEKISTPVRLSVPESLQPDTDRLLPELTRDTIVELSESGWSRVGLMVALTSYAGNVLMLSHNGRSKNEHGMLGPFGETSQESGPIIEQPLQTLWRGIREEFGIENPADLGLRMPRQNGWVINQWPVGIAHPGEYACAISFSAFVDNLVADDLLALPHGNEEIHGIIAMTPGEIRHTEDARLRPGVKPWLRQLSEGGLLSPSPGQALVEVDFTGIYEASLSDINLKSPLMTPITTT